MVKVRDEPSMAEPRPATTTTTTITTATTTAPANGTATTASPQQFNNLRKPPRNPHYHPHSFYHFPAYHHHHCTYPAEGAAETNGGGGAGGSSAPAKFYFGPGFEPQQQGGGRYGAGPSQAQNNEHVVFFHVNPGVTISFQFGDNMEVLRGKIAISFRVTYIVEASAWFFGWTCFLITRGEKYLANIPLQIYSSSSARVYFPQPCSLHNDSTICHYSHLERTLSAFFPLKTSLEISSRSALMVPAQITE